MQRQRALEVTAVAGLVLLGLGQAGRTGLSDGWSQLLWIPLLTVPLLARRTRPVAASLLLTVGGLAHSLLSPTDSPFVALVLAALLAFYAAGAHAPLSRSWAAPAVGLLAFWADDARQHHALGEYLASGVLVVGPWLAGRALRAVRTQNATLAALAAELSAEREARARDAVLAERARIAAELHDVVGHSVSVISLQSQAAEAALAVDPLRAREPLRSISAAAQDAMTEMRRAVALLHDADRPIAPTPGHGDLEALVEQSRASGLAVDLTLADRAGCEVPQGVQLATYRIVQEALTNVRRHSSATSACVQVAVDDVRTTVEVRDPGPPAPQPGGGTGLAGSRARAGSCGGTLDAGPCGAGWLVRAQLPHAADPR